MIAKVLVDATLAPELRGSYSKVVYPALNLAALLAAQPPKDQSAGR